MNTQEQLILAALAAWIVYLLDKRILAWVTRPVVIPPVTKDFLSGLGPPVKAREELDALVTAWVRGKGVKKREECWTLRHGQWHVDVRLQLFDALTATVRIDGFVNLGGEAAFHAHTPSTAIPERFL